MPTAALHVASTPELLEAILLQLDIRTLVTSAQQVSHTWLHLIKASPRLQQAMFFEPAPKPTSRSRSRSTAESPTWVRNPLLAEVFPTFFMKPPRRTDTAFPGFFRRLTLAKKKNGQRARQAAFVWANASWRRMLVTQPPIARLGVVTVDDISGGRYFGTVWKAGEVKFDARSHPRGLTMGVLYDITFDWVEKTRRDCAVQVLWRTATEKTADDAIANPRRGDRNTINGWSPFHKDKGIEGWDDRQSRLSSFSGILDGFGKDTGAVLRLYCGTEKTLPWIKNQEDGLANCKSLGHKTVEVELRNVLEQFTA